jgi:hypothetical protein
MRRQKSKPDDKKTKELIKKARLVLFIIIGIVIFIKLNKKLFFMVIFSALAFAGKQIRGQFGLKLIVLDPLMFLAIMVAKFLSLTDAVIFIALNTLVVDFITNIASEGTFFNFGFYSIGTVVGVSLFGGFNMMIYGNIASLLYSVEYVLFRFFIIPQDPFGSVMKAVTSFMFTFLYLTFFGPLLELLMTL